MLPRRIAHLDMDAFFASVELLRQPQLRGLPVVIGGGRQTMAQWLARLRRAWPEHPWADPTDPERIASAQRRHVPLALFPRLGGYIGRGVVTTATYAARRFGIGSAMGLMKAAQRCPEAILLPVDFEEYRRWSRAFKAVIREIAPVMEDRGIDEVYIDFTHMPGGQREGGRVPARLIQKSIFDATGLGCSLGVAPNKLLAKMASEWHKPNGIAVLHAEDVPRLVWPLPVRKIHGVGPKAQARLAELGVHTIGELAAAEPTVLCNHFGRQWGQWLHEAAWGRDERPLVTHREPESLSREDTFERNLHPARYRAELATRLTRLCEQLAADLQRKGLAARTVAVKLRSADLLTRTRAHTLPEPVHTAAALRRAAALALRRAPLSQPLRLLGVRASRLAPLGASAGSSPGAPAATPWVQASLFAEGQ